MCINVDLPEPDGPMIATNSPPLIRNDTSRNASTSSEPARYVLPTPVNATTGVIHLPPLAGPPLTWLFGSCTAPPGTSNTPPPGPTTTPPLLPLPVRLVEEFPPPSCGISTTT